MSNEEYVFGESVATLEEQKKEALKKIKEIKATIELFESNQICLEEMGERALGTDHARLHIYTTEAVRTLNRIKWAINA